MIKQSTLLRVFVGTMAWAIVMIVPGEGRALAQMARTTLPASGGFIENRGQWPEQARYLLRLAGADAWITGSSIVHDIRAHDSRLLSGESNDSVRRRGTVIAMEFVGARSGAHVVPLDTLPGHYHYLLGNDSTRWARHVRRYQEVMLQGLYSGIDARLMQQDGALRYDLIVAPQADPAQIRLRFAGSDGYVLNEAGELVIQTSEGKIFHKNLYAFQRIGGRDEPVQCTFRKNSDGTIGFALGAYDRSRALVIDPLVYSTYLGGSGLDHLNGFAVDAQGHAHVGGMTQTSDYPTTPGAYDRVMEGGQDMILSKLSPDGDRLIYSTFVGGSRTETLDDLVIGLQGEVCAVGKTMSSDFPHDDNTFDGVMAGVAEAVVFRLSVDGGRLLGSTFLGGSGYEELLSLAVDSSDYLYVKGFTTSQDFPLTPGAWRTELAPEGPTGFLSKISPDLTTLVYSTYFHGTARSSPGDGGTARELAVDRNGIAYLTGTVWSPFAFTSTPDAFDPTFNEKTDAYLLAFNATGTDLIFSTYLGGVDNDEGIAVAIGPDGDLYVTGKTVSSDFPATPGAYQPGHTGPAGGDDGFVARFDPLGRVLRFATFLGGTLWDRPYDISVERSGNILVTGSTISPDFPVTPGAIDEVFGGGVVVADAFISRISPDGARLSMSTFVGGENDDIGIGIVAGDDGAIHVAGTTNSRDFPTTELAYDRSLNPDGLPTLFVLKIGTGCSLLLPALADTAICVGASVVIGGEASGSDAPFTYSWSPATGLDNSSIARPTATPATTTRYTLNVVDALGCVTSASVTVTVSQPMVVTISADTAICQGSSIRLRSTTTSGLPPYKWSWSPAEGLDRTDVPEPLASPGTTTAYTLTVVDAAGCTTTAGPVTITVLAVPAVPTITRRGDTLLSSDASAYQWYYGNDPIPGETSQQHVATRPGRYAVEVFGANGCSAISEWWQVGEKFRARLDTVRGRVGDRLTLTMSIWPLLAAQDRIDGYTAWLRVQPRSLVVLDARSPASDVTMTDPVVTARADGEVKLVRAGGGVLTGEQLLYLDIVGLVTANPESVVILDSLIFDDYGPVLIDGNGLALLEGCDLSHPIALDRAVTILDITPNPIATTATIHYYVPEGATPFLQITDLSGTVISRMELAVGLDRVMVDLQHLPIGLYSFEIRDRNERDTRMVMIVH